MKSFVITKNDAGQRLDKYLTKSLPSLPGALMYKYIRLKRIKVNGKRAEISTRLCEGDTLEMYINDEFFEKKPEQYDFMSAPAKLDIVYEDDNILLLNKKVGLLAHPDATEYRDTLITRVERYLYEKGEYLPQNESSFAPALVNRIDRNTCGIVIAAKNAEALRILNAKMKSRELHKEYLCVVHGKPEKQQDTLLGWLYKDESKNKVKIFTYPRDGAKEIKTRYTVLESYADLSLLRIELLTGRTHQIRAHLAFAGYPLLGDGKYGSNALNKSYGYKKQCLCSYKLTFDFTSSADALDYLNGKSFEISDIWFVREFRQHKL